MVPFEGQYRKSFGKYLKRLECYFCAGRRREYCPCQYRKWTLY